MEEYYPSEIARLVLGYLKQVECSQSWKTFVQESFDLREYYNLYKQGKIYTTNVNGKSLVDTLNEYCVLKSKIVNKDNRNKCPNNTYQNNEVVKSPSKVTENTKVTIDQMVQTSASIPACQTPKRKSKCRVTHLNFDNESEYVNDGIPYDNVNEDELNSNNSVPNNVFHRNDVVSCNSHSKSVMTITPKLCDASMQTDLNFKDQNISSKSIQTENLCFCPPSFSESFQSNTEKISCRCAVSSITPNNVHNSSSPELAQVGNSSKQVKSNSGAKKSHDNVVEKSVSNMGSLSKIFKCGKNYISLETALCDQKSQSPPSEELDNDEHNNREERSSKGVRSTPSKSPVSNCLQQTVTSMVDTLENMNVAAEDFPVGDPAYEKNCNYDSDLKTTKLSSNTFISSVGYDTEGNRALNENCSDVQNIPNINNPDSELNTNNETTEGLIETSDPVHVNEVSNLSSLNLENNADDHEVISDKRITRSASSRSQRNNSDASTGSSNKLNAFSNVSALENKTVDNITSYSGECHQDLNSEYKSGEHEHQSDLDFHNSNMQNAPTPVDEFCANLTGDARPLKKCSEELNSTEYENGALESLSDLSLVRSKIQSGAISTELIAADSNIETSSEVAKLDAKNKAEVDDVINPEICQSSLDTNIHSTLSVMDKTEQNVISVNNQATTTVVPSQPSNVPSSCLVVPNSTITTYQSVPSGSFIQNNGQYQYFMFLPVQTVPTIPTVPLNDKNSVIPPPVTAVTSINNLDMASNGKTAVTSTKNGKHTASFITSSPKQDKIPCEIQMPSKKTKKASKKKKAKEKDLSEIHGKKMSSKPKNKKNLDKKILSSSVPSSSLITEETPGTENLGCSVLPSSKSPSYPNQSVTSMEKSEETDQKNIEKECRVLKVLVSDVLKSSHIRYLDYNADFAGSKDKNENHLKESSGQNKRSQPYDYSGVDNDEISFESSETDSNFNHKKKKISHNSDNSSSFRNKERIDTVNREINFESLSSCKTAANFNIEEEGKEFSVSAEKCSSSLHNVEEFNSESLNSTDALVTKITTALENCLDDMPDSIEVVVVSDTEEMNNEDENINLNPCVTTDKELIPDHQEINQQSLDIELCSEKEAGNTENHVNPMTKLGVVIDKIADNENAVSTLDDLDCRELMSPEVVDLGSVEENNVTFQPKGTEIIISSKNGEKDFEQNLVDNVSIIKQVINKNFEHPITVSNDFNSERDDLDSSRSLMINTSPFNDEDDPENLENSSISSDIENVENGQLTVNRSDYCNSFNTEENSNDVFPPCNSSLKNVSLHNEKQENMSSNIDDKMLLDESGIHNFEKQPVSSNSLFSAQKSNMNLSVKESIHDEKYRQFQLDNCSEKKTNSHLPQGIIDSVKYFNSQSKPLNLSVKTSVINDFISSENITLNSLQTSDVHKCESVDPGKGLNTSVNSETLRNENLKTSVGLIEHLDSPVVKDVNNDVPYAKKKKTVSPPDLRKETRIFSSTRLLDVEKSVADNNSPHLYPNEINNYSCAVIPFKKRMRHHSYDSSVNHNEVEPLWSSQNMSKSKNSKSLENVANAELYIEIDVPRKSISSHAFEKPIESASVCLSSSKPEYSNINCELKTSLNNQHKATYSNSVSEHSFSVKQNTDHAKNSLNCTSDASKHAKVILPEGNSLPLTEVQQSNSRKFSAKRLLLEEDSSSGEDSVPMIETFAGKFSIRRILFEKDAQTSQQSGMYSAKNHLLNKDSQSPVKVQQTYASDIKNTNVRLEEYENQSSNESLSCKNSPRKNELIQFIEEKKSVNAFKQTSCKESNISPEKAETQNISKIVCMENVAKVKNRELPCPSVSYKRKSSDSFSTDECLTGNCSDDKLMLDKNHCLDNNQIYKNDSTLVKRPKLNERPNSQEEDHFNNAFEHDASYLFSNDILGESPLLLNALSNGVVKSIKNNAEDSPARRISNTKKVIYKSALRKRIEKDPNIPPGVKIPSKWNTSKIITYSHAIGRSICDNNINPKRSNMVKSKKRQSRPTLKIATIQSPSKGILNDKKNLSKTLCSANCHSESPSYKSTVCSWVSKEKIEKLPKKPVKKSRKMCSQQSIKLGCEKTVSQNSKEKTVASISETFMEATNQVSDEKMLVVDTPVNNDIMSHCETTQDIVEADIGRSDEDGSELANAIASVEKELENSSPNNVPEFLDDTIDYELTSEEKSSVISDNFEPEKTKHERLPEFMSENTKLRVLLDKIRSMGVDRILEKIYMLEEEKNS